MVFGGKDTKNTHRLYRADSFFYKKQYESAIFMCYHSPLHPIKTQTANLKILFQVFGKEVSQFIPGDKVL